ncbi:hypothetical protein PO909_011429, partial [Leuciscus waleckii]
IYNTVNTDTKRIPFLPYSSTWHQVPHKRICIIVQEIVKNTDTVFTGSLKSTGLVETNEIHPMHKRSTRDSGNVSHLRLLRFQSAKCYFSFFIPHHVWAGNCNPRIPQWQKNGSLNL